MSSRYDELIEEVFSYLGLDSSSIRVYQALIKLGGKATATDISKASGLSLSIVYRALNELQKHGLVLVTATRPKLYILSDPLTITRLVEERTKKILDNARKLSEIVRTVRSIKRPETLCATIDTSSDVVEMLRYLIEITEDELILFTDHELLRQLAPYIEAKCTNTFVHLIVSGEVEEILKLIPGCIEESFINIRGHVTRTIMVSDGYRVMVAPMRELDVNPLEKAVYVENNDIAHITSSFIYQRIVPTTMYTKYSVQEERTYRFRTILAAIEFAKHGLSLGYELYARVEGIDVETRSTIIVEGIVYDIIEKPGKSIYHMLLVSRSKGLVSIGGFRAFVEDVSASRIEITPRTLPKP